MGGHSSAVKCLAYSPAESGVSTVIVSGSMDSSLAVWDARTGAVLRYLRGHKGPINDVCFLSPTQCLSASGDSTAMLWDVTTGKCLCSFVRHRQSVSVIAASKCRSIVVTGSWDKRIIVWKPESGLPVRECMAHRKSVTALSINDDGTRAISGGADNWVVVWDLRSAVMLFRFMDHLDIITHTTVSADGDLALTASADGMVAVWNLADGCLLSHLTDPNVSTTNAHDGMVCSTFIDRSEHDNKLIITVGKRDRTVKLWQMNDKGSDLLRVIEVEPDEPLCAGYNQEGSTFVLGLQNVGVAQWVVDWTLSHDGCEYGNTTAPKALPTTAQLILRQNSEIYS